MNNDARVLLQNTAGRFTQYYTANRVGLIGRELFCHGEDTLFELPDEGIRLQGFAAIKDWFDGEEARTKGLRQYRHVHLTHSHLNKPQADGTVRAMWITSSYDISGSEPDRDKAPYTWRYAFTRMDADMAEEDGQWKFKHLMWYGLESLLPESYNPMLEPGMFALGQEIELPPAPTGCTTAEDYLAIRNLQSRFTLNNRQDALADYADSEDISLELPHLFDGKKIGRAQIAAALQELDERERKNGNLYLSIPALYSPVIEVGEGGCRAEGVWLVMMFGILGHAYGFTGDTFPVPLRICRIHTSFIKENGCWKYRAMRLEKLFTPAFRSVQTQKSRGLINRAPANCWNEWPKNYNRTPSPEDSFAIEEILSSWVTYIQNGSSVEWFQNYLATDHPELKQVFPTREPPYDRYLIEKGMEGFSHFAMLMDTGAKKQLKNHGVHAVSTPMIEISADGREAVARSTEFGFTMFAGLTGPIPEPPFEGSPAVSVYEHHMTKGTDGKWRLYEFKWLALFQYSSFWFDPKKTSGWSGTCSKRLWPLPYARYTYSNDPNDPIDELNEDLGNSAFFRDWEKSHKD